MLPLDVLLKLKRWNTPTIYNGCETVINAALDYNRLEEQIKIAEKMNEAAIAALGKEGE